MRWFSDEKPPRHKAVPVPVQRGILPTQSSIRELSTKNFFPPGGADLPYVIPKDINSLNQRDLPHYIFRHVFKGNYLAPVEFGQGSRILDVGSGTGWWASEMAQAFPLVQVYGLDLQESVNRPEHSPQYPANYSFQAGNILKRLPFVDGSFDFVHQRLLLADIPTVQWYAVLRELIRVTCPGGWLEIIEGYTTVSNPGPATELWLSWRDTANKVSGIDLAQMPNLGTLVRQMGFSHASYTIDLPLGAWAGELGLLVQTCMLTVFDDFAVRGQQLGITHQDLQNLRAQLSGEWKDRGCQVRIFLVLVENKRA